MGHFTFISEKKAEIRLDLQAIKARFQYTVFMGN